MNEDEKLQEEVARQAERQRKAARERHLLLADAVHVGTLGLLFVLPVVGGAYLGHWLDSMADGYSVRWTISLIILGVVIGIINVYLNLKD